jgi:hypothetical protein
MKHTILFSILILVLALAGAAPAADKGVPSRIEMKYKVSVASIKIGEGLDVFEHDDKTYSVVSESKTTGLAAVVYGLLVRRESKGAVTPAGLRPESFVEMRNGHVKRSANRLGAGGGVADGDHKQTMPLPPNTWDATSFAWNSPSPGRTERT